MRRGTLGCHAPGPTLSLNAGLSCVMPVRAPQFSSPRFDPKTPVLWARLQCDVSRWLAAGSGKPGEPSVSGSSPWDPVGTKTAPGILWGPEETFTPKSFA